MEHEPLELGILTGMGVVALVLSLWKLIKYKFRGSKTKRSFRFWVANNWIDYIIHIGIAIIFFMFEHDVLNTINPLIKKLGVNWEFPHPENKGFLFVLVPLFVSVVLYPILRKYLSKPVQTTIAPHIHDEFCEHENNTPT